MLDLLLLLVALIITLWMAGAIYYDMLNSSTWAGLKAFLACVAVALLFIFWQPTWQPFLLLLWVFAIFVGWWLTLKPSNDRDWDANSAVLPSVIVNGDLIRFENIRHTEYRSKNDYTPTYYDKEFRLSNLRAVELLLFYWGSRWMSHPTLIFDFGENGRVCISIEVRYRNGQQYDLLRSIYRQQELIYQVCDERDAILQETVFSPDCDTYLYRLQADATEVRIVLLDYVNVINGLLEHPRWYNGLTTNCTTSIFSHPHNRAEWDWRMLINGWLDQCLYERGRLDNSLPFDELKKQSRINDIVPRLAHDHSLGDNLREQLWSANDKNTTNCTAESRG